MRAQIRNIFSRYAQADVQFPVWMRETVGCLGVAAAEGVRTYHLRRKQGGLRTGESARSSGLPAAIAKSPAVTVRAKSSQESRDDVDCLLPAVCGRREGAGGGGS